MKTPNELTAQILATLQTQEGKTTIAQIVTQLELPYVEAKKRVYETIKKNFLIKLFEAERNLPCPCASGKKFKKCCIQLREYYQRRRRFNA